jgi:glycosyltransferase involved in cell wall biosynthesis
VGSSGRPVRIAVYTIALNEEHFVERWYESAKGADYLLIADTGSTDGTVEKAKSLGINVIDVSVKPWRFDDARNASLTMIPKDIDICIQLDMDEVLVGKWRLGINKAFAKGANRITYRYISGWVKGKEGKAVDIEFNGFKCHSRIGYRWRYPIHEVVVPYSIPEVKEHSTDFEIHHYPDSTKSRDSYLPMLEMAVEEEPIPRHLYYLGREYYYKGRDEDAKRVLKEYIPKAIFPAEKGAACRVLAKVDPENAEEWLLQGAESASTRESGLALANYYYDKKMWPECFAVGERALQITEKTDYFLSENWAWGPMGYDIVALAAWSLGEWDKALKYGEQGLALDPTNERLQNNLKFYREKVNGNTK